MSKQFKLYAREKAIAKTLPGVGDAVGDGDGDAEILIWNRPPVASDPVGTKHQNTDIESAPVFL